MSWPLHKPFIWSTRDLLDKPPRRQKITKKLLTLENIRSGAVPSDAVAVGFLLGEIESLRKALDNRGRQLGIQPTVHEPEKRRLEFHANALGLDWMTNDVATLRAAHIESERQLKECYDAHAHEPCEPRPQGYMLIPAAVEFLINAADKAGVETVTFGVMDPKAGFHPDLPGYIGVIREDVSKLRDSLKSLPSQPPIDNEHVAEGCEKFNEQ